MVPKKGPPDILRKGKKPNGVPLRPKISMNSKQAFILKNVLRVQAYTNLNEPNLDIYTCPSCLRATSDFDYSTSPGIAPCNSCLSQALESRSDSPKHQRSEAYAVKKNARTCHHCSTTNSTMWRHDVEGKPLCNPCGQYLKRHGIPRPESLFEKHVIHRRRNRSRSYFAAGNTGPPVEDLQEADGPGIQDDHQEVVDGPSARSCISDNRDTDAAVAQLIMAVEASAVDTAGTTIARHSPTVVGNARASMPSIKLSRTKEESKTLGQSSNAGAHPFKQLSYVDLTARSPVDSFEAAAASRNTMTATKSSEISMTSPMCNSSDTSPNTAQHEDYQYYPWLALRDVVFMVEQMSPRFSKTDICKVLKYRYGRIHAPIQDIREESLSDIYKFCTVKCNLEWSRKGGIVWDRKGNVTTGVDSGNTFYERNGAVMKVIREEIFRDLCEVGGKVARGRSAEGVRRPRLP